MTEYVVGGRRRIDRVLAPEYLDGLDGLGMEELRSRKAEAEQEETDLSYARRLLQGRLDILRAEREARKLGLDILGFYHSHPDAPARPSDFDREHAWPWYAYVIAEVRGGVTVVAVGVAGDGHEPQAAHAQRLQVVQGLDQAAQVADAVAVAVLVAAHEDLCLLYTSPSPRD